MPVNNDVKILTLLSEALVQHNGASQVLVVGVNLLAQLVHKLAEWKYKYGHTESFFISLGFYSN